jgi:type I restriction enzyme S subunit
MATEQDEARTSTHKKAKPAGLLTSLPSLAEQRRIVAKVDALMALCERLETSLTEAADAPAEAREDEALASAQAREDARVA